MVNRSENGHADQPTVNTLKQRIEELEEDNLKLQAELGEIQQSDAKLRFDLENLEAIINNAPNFAAYRVVMDSDFFTHDLEQSLTSKQLDPDYWPGRVAYVSPNFAELTGLENVMNHKGWYSQIHPDDLPLFFEAQEAVLKTSILNLVYRHFHPNKKEWRWFHLIVKGTPDSSGVTRFFNGIIIDITEHKRIEQKLLAHQERLRALNDEVLNTEEGERRRIAGILHDSIGQKLFAAKWEMDRLSEKSGLHKASAIQAGSYLDDCITETHSLTTELYPRELYEFGLATALKRLAADYEKRFGFAIEFCGSGEKEEIPDRIKSIFFRAVSELLNNVAKHSRATKAIIALECADKKLKISVSDDGVGFDFVPVQRSEGNGFGLFSIKERLTRVGGEMHFEKPTEGGSGIVITTSL
jgi:PAS domain S-box-containing protein